VSVTQIVWLSFLLLISLIVALDLGVFHRKARIPSLAEALGWSAVWFALAMVFNVGVYFLYELNPSGWDMDTDQLSGSQAALQFFTGYLIEKSLSIDNIFVIAMVFSYFRVPAEYQHRVLFWGILGAVVLRGIMIVGGLALIDRFEWMTYLLGAILVYSGAKMLIIRHDNVDLAGSPAIAAVRRFIPITDQIDGSRFFTTVDGVRMATPLFVALVLVEFSDVMFAIDSIPAIFAITRDPFIVFTSNIFALLGLRSLFFVLAGLMHRFRYLKTSLAYLLAYIGVKMLISHHYPIPNLVSLAIISGILTVGIIASTNAARDAAALLSPLANELERLAISSYKQARRAIILLLGSSIMLLGAAMVVLPGPAILVIPLGLAILALEFTWAARWLARYRQTVGEATSKVLGRSRKKDS
jgi:tellurite resistance protein TerC